MATSTPTGQIRAPPAYAAVNTDPLGPDREGLNLEDHNLEESDDKEEDREEKDHGLQDTLYSHFVREIQFSILGVFRMLTLPTRGQE